MKAVVLAAGKGVRMLPLTADTPKVLIEVAGKPFLYYLIKNLHAAGITDIYLVVGYLASQVEHFIEDFDIKAKMLYQLEQLGTGDAVNVAKAEINEPFIVVMGDNLYSARDIKAIAKLDSKLNYVAAIESDHPEDYGVVEEKAGFLSKIVEKPKKPKSKLVNTGLYKLTPELFEALAKTKKSKAGEFYLTDALSSLAKQKKAKVYRLKDYWIDMSSIEQLPEIEQKLKELFRK
jgi:NDP-sugar pyrophosphorylase family protein